MHLLQVLWDEKKQPQELLSPHQDQHPKLDWNSLPFFLTRHHLEGQMLQYDVAQEYLHEILYALEVSFLLSHLLKDFLPCQHMNLVPVHQHHMAFHQHVHLSILVRFQVSLEKDQPHLKHPFLLPWKLLQRRLYNG